MKILGEIAKGMLPKVDEPKLVHSIQDAFILRYLDTPIMSNEVRCPICGGNNGYSVFIDPTTSDKRMWFCAEADCLSVVKRSRPSTTQTIPKGKRSIQWQVWCEINDLGDKVHDVSFEKVQQSSSKIDYLLKFSKTPNGIIVMEGDPGTGKSYASLALCELFTRTNPSAIFITQNKMQKKWLSEEDPEFVSKLSNVNLLVVDDFATGEVTPGFMKFFLDLIDSRLQWSNRGTVLTTNLDDKRLGKYCGEALADRINTGQKFQFIDKTRRKQTIL